MKPLGLQGRFVNELDAELEHAGEGTAPGCGAGACGRGDGAESADAAVGTAEDYAGEGVEADGISVQGQPPPSPPKEGRNDAKSGCRS